jgi:hypothetical protein
VRGPDAGILSDNPAELPLIESETVFKQSQPPLLFGLVIRPRLILNCHFEVIEFEVNI